MYTFISALTEITAINVVRHVREASKTGQLTSCRFSQSIVAIFLQSVLSVCRHKAVREMTLVLDLQPPRDMLELKRR